MENQTNGAEIINSFINANLGNVSTKTVEDLTDSEKMAIFLAAGVPVRWAEGRIITSVRVGLMKIDGKFQVMQAPRERGTQVNFKHRHSHLSPP